MAVPSFPDVHTTGPVHHYVRVPGSTAIYYLGTAEVTPKMSTRRFYTDVFNDKKGPSLPFQRLKAGEAATIGVLLTYYSETALEAILSAGSEAGLRNGAGEDGDLSYGAQVFGQESFELWQVFDFFNTEQATLASPGRYWPQVTAMAHDDDTVGTSGSKVLVAFDAQPKLFPRAGGNGQKWTLVRWDAAAFPADVFLPE